MSEQIEIQLGKQTPLKTVSIKEALFETPPVITLQDLLNDEKKRRENHNVTERLYKRLVHSLIKASLKTDTQGKNINDEMVEKVVCAKKYMEKKFELDIKPARIYYLLQFNNDPIEVLERLQQCGYSLNQNSFASFETLNFKIPRIAHLIKRLSQNGVLRDIFEKDLSFNSFESLQSLEKNLKDFYLNDEIVKNLADIASDAHVVVLLTFIRNDFKRRRFDAYSPRIVLANLVSIKKAALISDFIQIATLAKQFNTSWFWNFGYSPFDINQYAVLLNLLKQVTLAKKTDTYFPLSSDVFQRSVELTKDSSTFSFLKTFVEETIAHDFPEKNRSLIVQITHYICTSFLYHGDVAHELLETIKEKGWISIQTYNRLYAARRRFIGHVSYAYKPKKGDRHPVINVTYYKHHTPENMTPYSRNYKLYEQKKEKLPQSFISWYDEPKKYPADPEYEKVVSLCLPIGIADNGHTHYYATPYGIVSGCIAENRKEEMMNFGPLGVGLVTGHKEMLTDFLRRQGAMVETKYENTIPGHAVTIDFDRGDFPAQLKEMLLPPHISLGEALLNLHLEQYLHDDVAPNEQLLTDLMHDIAEGKVRIMVNNKEADITDTLIASSKITLEKKKP